MKLKQLVLKHYRNLADISFSPCDRVNVIYGDNGQGKTNLLEAIWLFTGNQSFRMSKMGELIQFGEKTAEVSIRFEDIQREQEARIKLGTKKEIFLNRVPLKKSGDLAGNFYCVVFSPSDLELAKGSPKSRRRFIDLAIAQITPQYMVYLDRYEKVLEQRNALLKEIERNPYLKETMEIWDLQLAKAGTILSIYRNDYLKKLGKLAAELYDGISSSREKFSLQYVSSAFDEMDQVFSYEDIHIQNYYQKLQNSLSQDIRAGFTSVGIHRDEMDLTLDGIPVKTYGSQGQQKSTVIALKLSEAALLKKVTGEDPIVLLDDVMSELDSKRQDYILNHVKDQQVFITCCDKLNTIGLKSGKIFHVCSGKLLEEQLVEEKAADKTS